MRSGMKKFKGKYWKGKLRPVVADSQALARRNR
jgi:hypothetical protein